ncbi:MAG: hypothetical protein PW788_11940 [Micavibrio sp.]|nr:hypothetical protein [Micavibrio sp.]
MSFGIKRTLEDDAGGASLDLAAAIAEFYQDFPQHRKDVFILNHQQFARGQDAVASIQHNLEDVQKEFPAAKLGMAKSLALGLFEGKLPASVNISDSPFIPKPESPIFARIVIPAGDEFSARLMKSIFVSNDPVANDRFPVMDSVFNNTEMWHRYVLDHELGHAVTQLSLDKTAMKTSSLGNKAECEADAYAMIRHFQRYGSSSDFPAYISDIRNMNAVQKGDVTHWTTRAIDEVIELNSQGKLAKLTPAEARDLSVDIARRVHLSADAEHNMQQAFMATVKITKTAQGKAQPDGEKVMNYIATVLETGANTSSPAVLESCKRYMRTIMTYVPSDLPQTKTKDELKAMGKNMAAMKAKALIAEPPMGGLKRIFRDAIIDAQSGKNLGNDNKPPHPPKKKFGGPAQ